MKDMMTSRLYKKQYGVIADEELDRLRAYHLGMKFSDYLKRKNILKEQYRILTKNDEKQSTTLN